MRRIEAQTGVGAFDDLKAREAELDELAQILKANRGDIVTKARKLVVQLKERDQELSTLKTRLATGPAAARSGETRAIGSLTVHSQRIDGLDMKELRAVADSIRQQIQSGVILLGSVKDEKVSLLLVSTPDQAERFPAGDLIKPLAAEVGGTGGGRAEMAQAGGKIPDGLDGALQRVFELVERKTLL